MQRPRAHTRRHLGWLLGWQLSFRNTRTSVTICIGPLGMYTLYAIRYIRVCIVHYVLRFVWFEYDGVVVSIYNAGRWALDVRIDRFLCHPTKPYQSLRRMHPHTKCVFVPSSHHTTESLGRPSFSYTYFLLENRAVAMQDMLYIIIMTYSVNK